jgi:hypothetical protein
MHPDDATDWTIRNQRHSGWSHWLLLGGWGVVWTAGAMLLNRLTPREMHWAYLLAWLVATLGSLGGLMVYLGGRPVKRLKLGDQLRAYPTARWEPKDIRAIRFGTDPAEDYAEAKLPFPLCQVTVEGRRRNLRLVASAGDAARLHAWAERKGVAVDDPQGLSSRCARPEPAAIVRPNVPVK